MSRICRDLDALVQKFRQRPLDTRYPYVWLDATYLKVRGDGRVVNQALVVAIGVNETGKREVLGFELGPSEDAAFWTAFLRSLVQRGLTGVRLVTSDAHLGLQEAIRTVLPGTTWQRCKVHLIRHVLAHVLKSGHPAVVRALRSIFRQPDLVAARRQRRLVVHELPPAIRRPQRCWSKRRTTSPREHGSKLSSTNPLERASREIKRRLDVVGIFPNQAAVLRLIGTILVQQHADWLVSRHYMSHKQPGRTPDQQGGGSWMEIPQPEHHQSLTRTGRGLLHHLTRHDRARLAHLGVHGAGEGEKIADATKESGFQGKGVLLSGAIA